jgi:hypothetical protein
LFLLLKRKKYRERVREGQDKGREEKTSPNTTEGAKA